MHIEATPSETLAKFNQELALQKIKKYIQLRDKFEIKGNQVEFLTKLKIMATILLKITERSEFTAVYAKEPNDNTWYLIEVNNLNVLNIDDLAHTEDQFVARFLMSSQTEIDSNILQNEIGLTLTKCSQNMMQVRIPTTDYLTMVSGDILENLQISIRKWSVVWTDIVEEFLPYLNGASV